MERISQINSQVCIEQTNEKVLVRKASPFVAELMLNKEKQMNCVSAAMSESICKFIDQCNLDSNIRVTVFRGKGKSFCSGGDLKSSDESAAVYGFYWGYKAYYGVATIKSISICILDGLALGGGMGLCGHSTFKIATENTAIGMPEAKIGFFTDASAGYFMPKFKNHLGTYMGLTSQFLKGKDTVRAGFAQAYIPSKDIEAFLKALYSVDSPDRLTEDGVRAIISKFSEEVTGEIENIKAIDRLFSGTLDEIMKKLENEEEQAQFARACLALINKSCPLSHRVLERLYKVSKEWTLRHDFEMEFLMVQRFFSEPDFFEGVRCLFYDKTESPKWKFKTYKDIPSSYVDKFFLPRQPDEMELELK